MGIVGDRAKHGQVHRRGPDAGGGVIGHAQDMAGQRPVSIRRAVHAHINHFAACGQHSRDRQRHGRHRANHCVACAIIFSGHAVENVTDGVGRAPAHTVGRPAPYTAGSDQQLRAVEQVHKKGRRRVRRLHGHAQPVPDHIRDRNRTGSERRRRAGIGRVIEHGAERAGGASSGRRAQINGDSRLVVDVPVGAVVGIDGHRPALAAQDLRPVRRRPGGAFDANGSVCPQSGHHRVGRRAGLGDAFDLGQRTQVSIQILKV